MKVLDTGFAREFIRLCNDGWQFGWHESNGGNASYRLRKSEANEVRSGFSAHGWQRLEVELPRLAGECFLITAAGSHFRSIAHDPKHSLGIIEIDRSGSAWRECWGFKGDAQPTSELLAHLICHEVRMAATEGKSRVIYHCHPADLAAMTNIVPPDGALFTRLLWAQVSECAFVFPEGVQLLSWEVPGSVALARKTAAAMERTSAVIWPHHGLFVAGATLDEAFGRAQTIEKAAGIYLKTCMTGRPYLSAISEEDILRMSREYGLGIEESGVFGRPAMRPEGLQQMSASAPVSVAPAPAEAAPAPGEVNEGSEASEAAVPVPEPEPVPVSDPVFAPVPEPVPLDEPLSAQELVDPPLSAQGFPKLGGPEMTVEAALEATPPAFRSQPQVMLEPQSQTMPESQPQAVSEPQPQVVQEPQPQAMQEPQPWPQSDSQLPYQPEPQVAPDWAYQPQPQREEPVYRYYPKPPRS